MKNQDHLPEVILTIVVVGVILFTGTYVLNGVVATDSGGGDVSSAALLEGTNWVSLGDHVGKNPTVMNSLGNAVELNGTDDSYWRSSDDVEIATDGNWTVSVWGSVNQSAENKTMTALSINGRITVNYNGSTNEWVAWYYDEADRHSYELAVNASDQPATLTNVQVVRNGDTLTLYHNNSASDSVSLANESSVSAPVESTNWDGRLDEVRTFDSALGSGDRDALVADPVAPAPDTNRTARIMFDEPGKDRQLLFFAPGSIITSNVGYADGLPGEKMERSGAISDITGSTDYRWDVVGPMIKPVDGGQLEHAPVAYVSYTRQSNLDTFVDDWTQAISLAGVLFILLPLGAIFVYLQAMRNSR